MVNSFDSPRIARTARPTGLTWDGTHLWCVENHACKMFKLDPSTGSLVSSFDSPTDWSRGLVVEKIE
jgi:hypothetical protein